MPKGSTAHGEAMRSRILAQVEARQQPPSYRELALAVHITENAVRHHIRRLIKDGLVARTPYAHRSLSLTDKGATLREMQRAAEGVGGHGKD